MSQIASGARRVSPLLRRLRPVFEAWRHPRSAVRRWRDARRWPRPQDFERMTGEEFDAYVKRIGFDARIKAALAEPDADDVPLYRDEAVSAGTRVT